MLSGIVQNLLEYVLHLIFEVACYWIGRVVVPVISLGRWKCEPIGADVPRLKPRGPEGRHRSCRHVYLTDLATQIVGLLSLVVIVGGGILIWSLSRH
jgi:hypothetical protein